MRIAVLTANLGSFDKMNVCVDQELPEDTKIIFHKYTDENFQPMTTAMAPRMQYRIPKLFGWQMFPDYDYYIWLDGSCSLLRSDCVKWYLEQIEDNDIALLKHPDRKNIKQETEYIEKKLQENNSYLLNRYKNGLHKEQLAECLSDPEFKDKTLYASTSFIYKNTKKVQEMMKSWWYHQSRYFTCDQIALSYVLFKHKLKVKKIDENLYNNLYLTITSKHK